MAVVEAEPKVADKLAVSVVLVLVALLLPQLAKVEQVVQDT